MKKWIYILTMAAGLTACIYPYKPEIETNPEETLVVDGHILVGGLSTIRLTYLTPVSGNVSKIPRGSAWIEDDLGNRYTVPPLPSVEDYYASTKDSPSSGNIFLTNNFNIDTPIKYGATKYRAVVELEDEIYSSAWITPDPAPEVTGIHFKADESTVTVYVDLKPGVQNTGYAGFLLDETWEFHSDAYPLEFIDEETWEYYEPDGDWEYPFYWCFRHVELNGSILVDYTTLTGDIIREIPVRNFLRSDSRNHKRYSILVKAFALSKEAYEYNKQTQEMSEIGGDLFSPDPGALDGNLICETHPEKEVMGYVQAGYVANRRAFLSNIYQRPSNPVVEYVQVAPEDFETFYYIYNYRPVKKMAFYDGVIDIGWAPHRCINCLEAGGTQEKPDYWDEPEQKEDY